MDRGFPDTDFREVMLNVWLEVIGQEPSKRQYELARYIECGPDPSRSPWEHPNNMVFINAFRGIGKSWAASALVPHLLNQWRDLDILVASASKARADDFSIFTKRLINEMPWWQHMIPREDQKQRNDMFDVNGAPAKHAPSVKSVGITGMITGSRADVAILDDVESLNNSMTITAREILVMRVQEIIGAVLKPGGRVIVLGTQQGVESVYGKFPEYGFKQRIWPARMPSDEWMDAQGEALAPAIQADRDAGVAVGTPTDPSRFNDADLTAREARYGRSGFGLQFMLDTRLSDENRFPLKCSDLIVSDLSPDGAFERYIYGRGPETAVKRLPCMGLQGDRWWGPMAKVGTVQPYQGVVMAIDPSGTGADEMAYSVVGHLNGTMFLLSNGGFKHGYKPENLEALAEVAKYWGVQRLVYEKNFGDGMFGVILKPIFAKFHPHCSIEEITSHGQKELRIIDILEPVMNQHRLVINQSLIEADAKIDIGDLSQADETTYRLINQMTRITKDRGCLAHDDRLESLALAVSHYSTILLQNEDTTLTERHKERFEQQIMDFMRSFDHPSAKEDTWLTPLDPHSS